jgi:hypothetical protein
MNIFVTINFKDKQKKIKLETLLSRFEYFKNLIKDCSNYQMTKTIENGVTYTEHSFRIPELSVPCSYQVFLALFKRKYKCKRKVTKDKEFLLELMIMVDYFMVPFEITKPWFHPIKEYDFIKYVKQQYPHHNAFDIIKNGQFSYWSSYLDQSIDYFIEGKIDDDLAKDLIPYLEFYLTQEYNFDSKYSLNMFKNVILSIQKLYHINSIGIKNSVNTIILKNMLTKFIDKYINYNGCLRKYYIVDNEQFNHWIDFIYDEFEQIELLGLIDISQFDSRKSCYVKI